jgi:hypothetical protein
MWERPAGAPVYLPNNMFIEKKRECISIFLITFCSFLILTCGEGRGRNPETLDWRFDTSLLEDAEALCCLQNLETAADGVSADQGVNPRSIKRADIRDDGQVVRLKIGKKGLDPNVLVLEKNIPAKIRIQENRSVEGYTIYFPAYGQTQRFSGGAGIISLTPDFDLSFVVVHKYGRFEGFIYITDDVRKISKKRVADFIATYIKVTSSK